MGGRPLSLTRLEAGRCSGGAVLASETVGGRPEAEDAILVFDFDPNIGRFFLLLLAANYRCNVLLIRVRTFLYWTNR